MRHKKIKSLLGAYYDGELEEKERIIIERHLEKCEECLSELNIIKEIELLSSEPVHEPGENYWNSFAGRVKRRISEREVVEKRGVSLFLKPYFMRLTVALASIILIAILSIFYVESLKSTKEKVLSQQESLPAGQITEKEQEKILKPEETLAPRPEREEKKLPPASKPKNEELMAKKLEKIEQLEEMKKVEELEKTEASQREVVLFARAKEGFSEEEEIYQKGLRFQEAGNYNEALKSYQSILYNYPSGKRASQAQFQINTISLSQWDKSNGKSYLRKKIEIWEDFIKKYPNSELIPSAKKNRAEAYYQLAIFTKNQKDIEEAVMAIEDFLKVCTEDKEREKFEKMLKEIKELR